MDYLKSTEAIVTCRFDPPLYHNICLRSREYVCIVCITLKFVIFLIIILIHASHSSRVSLTFAFTYTFRLKIIHVLVSHLSDLNNLVWFFKLSFKCCFCFTDKRFNLLASHVVDPSPMVTAMVTYGHSPLSCACSHSIIWSLATGSIAFYSVFFFFWQLRVNYLRRSGCRILTFPTHHIFIYVSFLPILCTVVVFHRVFCVTPHLYRNIIVSITPNLFSFLVVACVFTPYVLLYIPFNFKGYPSITYSTDHIALYTEHIFQCPHPDLTLTVDPMYLNVVTLYNSSFLISLVTFYFFPIILLKR